MCTVISLCHFTFKSLKPEITNCPINLPPRVSPAQQEAPQVALDPEVQSSETSLCSSPYPWSASRCCCCVSLCGSVFLHLLGHTPAHWLSNCGPGPLGIPESLSECRGPISLSLTSVQWSFGRPHVL